MTVNADEKWIENTFRLLGLSQSNEVVDSLWLGLVRIFNHDLGFSLSRSAELAAEALNHKPSTRETKLGERQGGEASIMVDIARYHSRHNAALSAALILGGPRRRGRPSKRFKGDAQAKAEAYGIDMGALREGMGESPATRLQRLDENARFIAELRG